MRVRTLRERVRHLLSLHSRSADDEIMCTTWPPQAFFTLALTALLDHDCDVHFAIITSADIEVPGYFTTPPTSGSAGNIKLNLARIVASPA